MMRFLGLLVAGLGLVLALPGATASAEEGVGAEYMVMEVKSAEAAQEPFLSGLALLHNFEYSRAAAAFREAQAADPAFVMAYWGEAMTHNHPLWAEQDRKAALEILSKLGETRDERSAKARTLYEAQWLDAVEALYAEEGSKEERDLAYLAKMREIFASNPDDIDARAFTGLAILGSSHGGRQIPLYMEAAGLLEPGFMTNEMHPGILHYLIHSYDDPVHAPLGERMAERYAKVAPNAGHSQHMVSHIFHALADWEASEAANVNAVATVNRQRFARGEQETFCGHYNEWLVYALLQQGKDASAIVRNCHAQVVERIERHAKNPEESEELFGAWSAARVANFLGVDTGEWLVPLAIPTTRPIETTGAARFMQAHGMLLQYRDDADRARTALEAMQSIRQESLAAMKQAEPEKEPRFSDWGMRAIERGEALVLLASGEREKGLAMLEEAAAAELAMPIVFGPPAILKPSFEILGEELLADGRKEEAAEAFRSSLELAPGRYLSLEGLREATS
jgi:tetratricopeptide (TPR) repeat protein